MNSRLRLLWLLILTLTQLALIFSGDTTPQPGTIDGFGMGSSAHLRMSVKQLSGSFGAQQAMGVRWAREEIPWREVETQPGKFVWAYDFDVRPRDFNALLTELQQRDIQMVAVLAYDPWDNPAPSTEVLLTRWEGYVKAVVSELGDHIHYWEISNEMNSRGFWGKVINEPDAQAEPDPVLYARMLQTAHDVIKHHNPKDVVILGGLAGYAGDLSDCATNYFHYLDELHQAGAWPAFDVIAIHPYRENHPPEQFILRGVRYSPTLHVCQQETVEYNLVSEVRAVRDLAQILGAKPIWITEIGWDQSWLEEWADYRKTTANLVDADLVEADWLVRTYVPLLSEPGVEKIFWYTQYDDPFAGQFSLGTAGQRALGITSSFLTGSKPLGQFQGQQDQGRSTDDDVYEYRFAKGDQLVIVLWKVRGGDTARNVTVKDLDVDQVRLYTIDAADLSPEAGRALSVENGTLTVSLTERPVFIVAQQPNWWDNFWRGLQRNVEKWWEEQKAKLQKQLKEWFKELERQITEWFQKQLEQFFTQLCGTAMLPGGMAAVWWVSHKKRRR